MAPQPVAANWRLVVVALACCFAMLAMAFDGSPGRKLPSFHDEVASEAFNDYEDAESMDGAPPQPPSHRGRMAAPAMAMAMEADSMMGSEKQHARKVGVSGQAYQRMDDSTDSHRDTTAKLIKSFDVAYAVTVNNTAPAFDRISSLVTNHAKAYIERSNRQSRNGHLTIRAPSDTVDVLLASMTSAIVVDHLGRLDSESASVEDVTLRYVDQAARVTSLKTARDQLNRLVTEAGSVADVLNVQRELTRVQAQLDSQQAQLNHLDNQVGLSTVRVQLWEEQPQPPKPDKKDLGVVGQALADVARAWAGLLHVLVVFGVQAALFGLPLAGMVTIAVMATMRAYRTLRPASEV